MFGISDEPNKGEIQTNITMSDNFIVGVVQFEMIYPPPECNFVVNVRIDYYMTCFSITNFKSLFRFNK